MCVFGEPGAGLGFRIGCVCSGVKATQAHARGRFGVVVGLVCWMGDGGEGKGEKGKGKGGERGEERGGGGDRRERS